MTNKKTVDEIQKIEETVEAPKAPARKNVKKTAAKSAGAAEKAAKAEKIEKPAKAEKTEKPAKAEKAEKTEKAVDPKRTRKPAAKKAETKAPAEAAPVKAEASGTEKTETPAAPKRSRKAAPKKAAQPAEAPKPAEEIPAVDEPKTVIAAAEETRTEEDGLPQPRRSVAFIGSECYPFVKTGGLGDVMYALPRALTRQNSDVKVILPRYKCIPWEYQQKMIYRGEFYMNLCADGRSFYVGIMEYVWDGVVYDFIDNEEFFSAGNPYISLVDDIPKFCFFAKAALAALNYMDWIPDVIHCHDWQAALVPVYLRTLFANTPVGRAKTVLTIHNLRFQGVYNIPTLKYWTGLPDEVFTVGAMQQNWDDANMLKAGLAYADRITTVSHTYAGEIQTGEYGEGLDAHLRYHAWKLRGIVNGIDCEQWDSSRDELLAFPYEAADAAEKKRQNKRELQQRLGLEPDEDRFVIGLISRLTDQKGLDLVRAILPAVMDGNTQVVVLGTGDSWYEDAFRVFEVDYKGSVCSNIMYDEGRAHAIYAGADALLVPSRFEPCGLTQLIAMRYGTVPIVRETGGLKDTVAPYNKYTHEGNGFTFDRYEAGLLLDAINRAKTVYFTDRESWDAMVQRDMAKDVSWDKAAREYRALYLELRP
ncbi:MAG: glycogen/starch synthase [Oscillospiraceae bacterium]|nr:glycogen/starch synthase [Oscillospiraceae bacterium]